MIYDAEAKMLATKNMTPTEPPNSGPNARLIITITYQCQGTTAIIVTLTLLYTLTMWMVGSRRVFPITIQ